MEAPPETDHIDWWITFLQTKCKDELKQVYQEYPFRRSITISYSHLLRGGKTGIEQIDRLMNDPESVIEDVRAAIRRNNLIFTADDAENVNHLNIRFVNFPKKRKIRGINASDIDHMVSLECVAKKCTEIRPRVVEAVFRCLQCGTVTAPYRQGYDKFQEPYRACTSCEKQTKMDLVDSLSKFVDTQKMRVQEPPESLKRGQQPAFIDLDIIDDLCLHKVYPGDRVIVNGIVRSYQIIHHGRKSPYFKTYVEVNSFERFDDDYDEISLTDEDIAEIEKISKSETLDIDMIKSIAPSIYGHEDVKRAITLQLFSGVTKEMVDGTTRRGDIHVLLCTDPGLGKSQLLRYVAEISPHGEYASGQGSSQAGLTASVLKDDFGDGSYTAEAGAMVLANNGILALDEADKMRDEDLKSIHTAMEQQIISIHKAGINMDLPARCAILAAANPKFGRFDLSRPIADQVKFDPAMMSRFDLIFVMDDRPDKENDRRIAAHIGNIHKASALRTAGKEGSEAFAAIPVISPDIMRKYVAFSRKITPILSDEVNARITDYYGDTRQINGMDQNSPVPITTRAAEAAIRLSEAQARMHLSEHVTLEHAEKAIQLIDYCLKRLIWDSKTQQYDIDRLVCRVPASGRNVIDIIKETINAHSPDAHYITEDKLYQSVHNRGVDKTTLERMVKYMKDEGALIQASPGHLKLIEV